MAVLARSGSDAMARRRAARLAAVQALYQIEAGDETPDDVLRQFVRRGGAPELDGSAAPEADPDRFESLVRGVGARREEIDALLAATLDPGWPLARLERVLRAILRAGAFELVACPEVPARVAISEYVDIADAFYGGKEPGMVNGVLDRLARQLRPQELPGDAPPAAS
jgi:N utilization substance protein B